MGGGHTHVEDTLGLLPHDLRKTEPDFPGAVSYRPIFSRIHCRRRIRHIHARDQSNVSDDHPHSDYISNK